MKLGARGKALLIVSSFAVPWLLMEAFFRLFNFDFDRLEQSLKQLPIYVRKPALPLEPVFFRRAGPEEWTGKVLHAALNNERQYNGCYADEPSQTIRYDRQGFRNREDLVDWEVVVVGDSFVEAGYLKEDDLLTSELARELKVGVKNLGVSWSGTFSHATYLRNFGKANSTRHAVLVFFEGNDLGDNYREYQALTEFRRTGRRPSLSSKNASSLTRALWLRVKPLFGGSTGPSVAWAEWAVGSTKTPVTVDYLPPPVEALTPEHRQILSLAFQEWAGACHDLKLKPWLVYMPAKLRVLHSMLKIRPGQAHEFEEWKPNGLPKYIAGLAQQHGIEIIDLVPTLTMAAQKGVMPYNALFDSHLSREGSLLVGKVIAARLHEGN